MKKAVKAARYLLGENFLEEMVKNEVYKPETRTVVDTEEIKTAMYIVPRAILLWLVKNLRGMADGDTKSLKIPMVPKGVMNINKHGADNYSGDLVQDNVKKYDFESRALPSVGLVIMSTFELYDFEEASVKKDEEGPYDHEKAGRYLNEKLETQRLVEEVLDKRISEKDAIKDLMKLKLIHKLWHLEDPELVANGPEEKDSGESKKEEKDGKSKLRDFVKKHGKNLIELDLEKSEKVVCPTCDSVILEGGEYDGCFCFGEDRLSKFSLVKGERGVGLYKFGNGWDQDTRDRLVKIIKDRKNRR